MSVFVILLPRKSLHIFISSISISIYIYIYLYIATSSIYLCLYLSIHLSIIWVIHFGHFLALIKIKKYKVYFKNKQKYKRYNTILITIISNMIVSIKDIRHSTDYIDDRMTAPLFSLQSLFWGLKYLSMHFLQLSL